MLERMVSEVRDTKRTLDEYLDRYSRGQQPAP
jgi:hypothetical protein